MTGSTTLRFSVNLDQRRGNSKVASVPRFKPLCHGQRSIEEDGIAVFRYNSTRYKVTMEENHKGWKMVKGVRQDVVELYKHFASTNSVRYEDFAEIWRKMKFTTIFSYRSCYIERLEFVEEVFQIIKEYLSAVYEFHTRVAALYTLYGLYFKQVLRTPVPIRVTKSEWEDIQSLILKCKNEKHFDIVYIYLKLFLSHAFLFTATPRTAGLEIGFRKYYTKKFNNNNFNIELLYKPLLSDKLIGSLIKVEELYCEKKSELLGKKNLDFIDKKFASNLQKELQEYANKWQPSARLIDRKKKPGISGVGEEISDCDPLNDESQPGVSGCTRKQAKGRGKGWKITSKHLMAKRKAELYIKQFKAEDDAAKVEEPSDYQLPSLDFD